MDVVSLSTWSVWMGDSEMAEDLHGVAGEEFFQGPLRGRVRQIANVQTTSLSSTSYDCFVLGSVDGLTTGEIVIASGCNGSYAGIGQGLGDIIDGRHGFDGLKKLELRGSSADYLDGRLEG